MTHSRPSTPTWASTSSTRSSAPTASCAAKPGCSSPTASPTCPSATTSSSSRTGGSVNRGPTRSCWTGRVRKCWRDVSRGVREQHYRSPPSTDVGSIPGRCIAVREKFLAAPSVEVGGKHVYTEWVRWLGKSGQQKSIIGPPSVS